MKYLLGGAAIVLLATVPAHSADIVVSTSGVFINPQPGTAVVSGVNTNDFFFGAGGDPSEVKFTGLSNAAGFFDTPFSIGTLYFYNGSITSGSGADSVDLKISMNFTTPSLPVTNSTFTFNLVSTPNTGTPADAADYLYFPAAYSTTTFNIGGTTYYVKLTGFGNIVGDGYLSSDSSQLHVLEESHASAQLFAEVTAVAPPAVPEPASWALMIAGVAAVGSALRRRQTTTRVQFS